MEVGTSPRQMIDSLKLMHSKIGDTVRCGNMEIGSCVREYKSWQPPGRRGHFRKRFGRQQIESFPLLSLFFGLSGEFSFSRFHSALLTGSTMLRFLLISVLVLSVSGQRLRVNYVFGDFKAFFFLNAISLILSSTLLTDLAQARNSERPSPHVSTSANSPWSIKGSCLFLFYLYFLFFHFFLIHAMLEICLFFFPSKIPSSM